MLGPDRLLQPKTLIWTYLYLLGVELELDAYRRCDSSALIPHHRGWQPLAGSDCRRRRRQPEAGQRRGHADQSREAQLA
jgi:hypothetical protein